jgi:hypothetical protein
LNIDRAAGAFLVGLPIAFNLFFFLLGRFFDYPAILRRPAGEILSRFPGRRVAVEAALVRLDADRGPAGAVGGITRSGARTRRPQARPGHDDRRVLAAVAQALGLARWPFLVPALARTYEDPKVRGWVAP